MGIFENGIIICFLYNNQIYLHCFIRFFGSISVFSIGNLFLVSLLGFVLMLLVYIFVQNASLMYVSAFEQLRIRGKH